MSDSDLLAPSPSRPAASPLAPPLPSGRRTTLPWGHLHGSGIGLAVHAAALQHEGPVLLITADMPAAERLEHEIRFFGGDDRSLPVMIFPDRETLPYDLFSPHQDIISERIGTLNGLATLRRGIIIAPVATLMVRVSPRAYIAAHSLVLEVGERLDLPALQGRLDSGGYRRVAQVLEHGEYAVRGSLVDLFPMGSARPFRIDLLDDEVESIRIFDPDSQRSVENIDAIRLLPAREFPLDEEAIGRFRQNFRSRFSGDPQQCPLYRDVSQGLAPAGIEYYLSLFFPATETLFDHLPPETLVIRNDDTGIQAEKYWAEIDERYESGRHDIEHPLLAPSEIFIPPVELEAAIAAYGGCEIETLALDTGPAPARFGTRAAPPLALPTHASHPLAPLLDFCDGFTGRVLLVAETPGRREAFLEMLQAADRIPAIVTDWNAFLAGEARLSLTVAALDRALVLTEPPIAVITESQIFGEHAMQRRRRGRRGRDAESVIANLNELAIGAPVVHEDHGVGRYRGLQTLTTGEVEAEYLKLEYADGDILYVPVVSLHLIGRYTGATAEQAPLHKLGSGQWQRAKRRAAERARDAAAELLDIYARRQARQGHIFPPPDDAYASFAAAFPFEETPDQQDAINDVVGDMSAGRPMDRLVCGDVGFGKTEVAMRAAFLAVHGGVQVAILVPTTLLAQQHHRNFRDRFADYPVRIETLSRLRTGRQQQETLAAIADGKVDIVIGTHKLLQEGVKFKNLGLVILDEEHRFGVRQKERFKAMRAEVDVLTLTATPIPRTLNLALSGLRDLSIIATAPQRRLAIKTFVREWSKPLLREACLREIRRGGQIYVLHNEVRTIERITRDIQDLVPEAQVRYAHGQMSERELERIMLDFYHQRFNLLVCTTIIESGIDVPNANTIVINRADRLGLAQLYQLRGRVGRSHHQAYAFLLVPPRGVMTSDAVKRLQAIESIDELGAGFTLATHDLEIRGAGEFLGEEQSGHIQEIGFGMYTELLERAVAALKSGKQPELDAPLTHDTEIDLGVPALLPSDYLPDVHERLVMYKRIASAHDDTALRDLQVEMIDRFGLLPAPAKNLLRVAALKLRALPLGVRRIEVGGNGGRFLFETEPRIDVTRLIELVQQEPRVYRFDGRQTLRFSASGGDLEERIGIVERLVEELSPDDGSATAEAVTPR